MDLPINNEELGTIVKALTLGGDTALYQKLKLVKETIDANPGGPYKKIPVSYTHLTLPTKPFV